MTDNNDVEKSVLQIMLEIVDISEKFQKMGSKEITSMITALSTTSKKPILMKKMMDLEEKVGTLRKMIAKNTIQSMLQKDNKIKDVQEEKTEDNSLVIPVIPAIAVIPVIPEILEEKPVKKPAVKKTVKQTEENPEEKEKPLKKPAVKKTVKKTEENPPIIVAIPEITKKNDEIPVLADPGVEESTDKVALHVARKKIPKHIKTLVWNEYIGEDSKNGYCSCCKKSMIENTNFHCGHVIADSKGGGLTIQNLRPICAPCNSSMGTQSMNEFTKTFFGWEV